MLENAVAKVHFRMSFCKTQITIIKNSSSNNNNNHDKWQHFSRTYAFIVCFHVIINIYTRIAFREFLRKEFVILFLLYKKKIAESSMFIVLILRFRFLACFLLHTNLSIIIIIFESIFVEHCIGSFIWIMQLANKRCMCQANSLQ